MTQDLRLAGRMLWRTPAFSAMAILTLALGIGANTAIFSVIDGAILTPLDFEHADRILRVWSRNDQRNLPFFSVGAPDYLDWKESARTFDAIAAYDRQRPVVVTGDPLPEEVQAARMTADVFTLLGTPLALGRGFTADEDRPGGPPVVIVTHGFWQRRLGGTRDAIGRTLTLDGQPHTVVGVLPRGVGLPSNPAELLTPSRISRAEADTQRGNHNLRVLARLRPGVSAADGRAELERLAAAQAVAFPATNGGWTVNTLPLFDSLVGEPFRRSLFLLAGVVGFVLLIASANVASLLLARSAARRPELAIRAALGAGRGRLVAQLLTESLLLASIASGLALLIAAWGVQALQVMEPANVPRLNDIRIDRSVLLFTFLIASASAILCGTAPALRAARWDILPALQASSSTRTTAGRDRLRHALVIGEVGLALVVLVGAALMVQSLMTLRRVDLGFSDSGVITMSVSLPAAKYPPAATPGFYDRLLARLRHLPGVTAAGAISSAPFAGPNTSNVFLKEGASAADRTNAPDADYRVVTGEYFQAMRIPLRRGRVFDARDRLSADPVVIISELTARQYWPNEDPIGQRLRFSNLTTGPLLTIVGVVGDVRYFSLDQPVNRPAMYFSQAQTQTRGMTVVVQAATDPSALGDLLRRELAAIDRDQPVSRLATMREILGGVRAESRFATSLFVTLGALALVLAVVGLYGLMMWSVLERRRELGVRLALGATRGDLLRLVLRRGLGLTVAGIAIGVMLSLALGGLLQSLLVGVSASDPRTIAAIATGLLVVALLACLVPARRVLRLDPVRALRAD